MKTNLSPKSSVQGNTLLVALMLCLILTISIAGYLKNATTQNYHSARSQAWNMSMTVTEAAIEEAMEHLNSNTDNLAQQGWTQSGVSKYTIKRNLTPTTTYSVTIDMTTPNVPRITAKSADAAPLLGSGTSFAAAGLDATSTAATVGRAVQVKAWRSGLFLKAMVAKHQIDMNGNGVMTDSFDSTDPNHSNNGHYPAGNSSKLLDNGDVASNDSVQNIVNIGNANIYGHVAVGPGGSVSIGSNGGVGTHAWQAGNGGIQDGYFSDDMNFTFGSYPVPSGGSSVTKGPFTVTNVDVTISSNTVTSSIYPSPMPVGGVQSNLTYLTVTTKPNPLPAGTVTNTLTTYTTNTTYPASGTYIGTVSSYQSGNGNGNGNGNKTTYWTYNAITGYSYTYPGYTYTYATYLSTTNISINKYDYVLDGSSNPDVPQAFYMNSFSGGTILIRKNVQLSIGGNFSMSGQDALTLASDGKLAMYVGGTSCTLGGNGVINPSGYARNFILYCADSVTSMSFSGNGMFCGILVAPNANLKLNGGGNDNNDFVGSVIANTITLNGHFSFHYDESLKNLKNSGRYIIREWHEIPLELAGD